MSVYLEIANSIYDTFIAKLNLLKLSGDSALNDLGDDLLKYIDELKNELEEEKDDDFANISNLIDLKNSIEPMIELLGLLIASTKKSSGWAIPLIEACYEKLGIDLKNRKILTIHTLSRIKDNQNTFLVHIDILKKLPYEVRIKIEKKLQIDVFEIPSETQFNLSSLAILGHEVGHVLWDSKNFIVKRYKNKLSEQIKQKYNFYNLFDNSAMQEDIATALAHTEELFCDCAGRAIFDIIFDIALLKALCFSNNGMNANRTHPPGNLRAELSLDSMKKSELSIINDDLKKAINALKSGFRCSNGYVMGNQEEVLNIVNEIKEELIKKRSIDLDSIWKKVSKELDAFRPPIETVSVKKPNLFTPIEILIGSVLYSYFRDHYIEKNVFLKDSTKTLEENENILLKKIKEHVIYAIGNYSFLKKAYSLYINSEKFEEDKLSYTLWSYRERLKFGTQKGVFSVVPSIYPNVQYGQNSVDIRLGSHFLIHKPTKYINISPYPEDEIEVENFYEEIYIPPGGEFILHPHQFVLASTLEYISMPVDYYGLILGRSTWGRLGLTIATATTVQAGFKGCITLELKNVGETPLPLKVGNRISQLCLVKIPEGNKSDKAYYDNIHAKYIGPIKAEIPKIKQDIDWELLSDI